MTVLDIGCGKKKREANPLGLDRQPEPAADVLCELTHFPWRIQDACAGRIHLSHFLGH